MSFEIDWAVFCVTPGGTRRIDTVRAATAHEAKTLAATKHAGKLYVRSECSLREDPTPWRERFS